MALFNFSRLLDGLYEARRRLATLITELLGFAYIKIYLAGILVINLANWLFAGYINRRVSQDLVVLHYNIDFGVNLIGSVRQIYLIPLLGLLIFLLNFILIGYLYKNERFAAHLLLAGALTVNLFLLGALAALYLVNFV